MARLLQGDDGSAEGVSPGGDGPQQLSLLWAQSWQELCWRVQTKGGETQAGWGSGDVTGVWAERLLGNNRL